jgi:CBS domain-containing protein
MYDNHNGGINRTVLTLSPSIPLTCSPKTTIYEAAQLMISKKENCMLVIDDINEELLGIFTAKDLAFRVVGSKLDVNETTVIKIMTSNPMCAKTFTLANDALNLMVVKHFRHLPIINNDNQIIGVLDITKCYNEAMKKLEKLYENSKKLYDAMETVNKELGNSVFGKTQSNYIITYFENLKKLLSGPSLNQLLNDETTLPVYCSINSNVYDAAMLMKLKKTTAILVRDLEDEIVGIFTSKDVVSRVIGKGLNPNECKVMDVMTESPAYASSNMSINKALKQMFEGKYLNLPVINEETGEIVGVVDIIRLTNFTLNQIQTMETINEDNEEDNEELDEGDFNKFLTTFTSNKEEHIEEDDNIENNEIGDVSMDELAQFDLSTMSNDRTYSHNDNNFGNRYPKHKLSLLSIGAIDYDQVCFFKFKVSRGRIHRISYKPSDGIKKFKEILREEFTEEELENFDGGKFEISYIDEDGDIIVINTDKDLKDCVLLMKSLQRDKIEIMLYDKHEILIGKRGKMSTLNLREKGQRNINHLSEKGYQNGYILPMAIFTLAATIAVVFTISRRQ